jgi:CPA2 family monovalent cation:H+ antiporter-2
MWLIILDLVLLLSAAMLLGAIAERLRQSALLGYLVAGILLGPNTLGLIATREEVETLAELGVALLLFTIGLEFSWRRLRRTGAPGLVGGSAQVLVTLLLVAVGASLMGLDLRSSVALGAMIALSSTATVLRILVARAQLDSVHGRTALGVLLVQDVAVVPLIVLVTVMNDGSGLRRTALTVIEALGAALLLFTAFFITVNYIVPLLLRVTATRGYRELPILLAIVVGLGSAIAAHELGLSPALGAFIAGMLMAESPYATQIRADISALRTLLITLFFSSIGMFANPVWAAAHWLPITLLVFAIVIGKTLVVWLIMRLLRQTDRSALAAGLCLAQVGEFSFVLAEICRQRILDDGTTTGFLDPELFALLISATIVTLFLTPYLAAWAPRIANRLVEWRERGRFAPPAPRLEQPADAPTGDHIVIIGYGPSGEAVGETLAEHPERVVVVDLNPKLVRAAQLLGFRAQLGDARAGEVLENLQLTQAAAVVVTVPDPETSRSIIHHVRAQAPRVPILARSRYHIHRFELELAGAQVVVDEERVTGARLAQALWQRVGVGSADRTTRP